MASKIHTDDPHHHKYVVVNKHERKKHVKKCIFLLSLLFPRWMHEPVCHGYHWHFCRRYPDAPHRPYTTKGTIIVWDDCNHKTFRVLKKRKTCKGGYEFIKRRNFLSHYDRYYGTVKQYVDGIAHFHKQ